MSAPDDLTPGSEQVPCGISTLIPLGMSCRGRAEAFARRLQSRLRTLGSQQGSVGDSSNGADGDHAESTWLTQNDAQVTSLQPPLRTNLSQDAAADSFFDFDMEPESPESPIDECEYSRLIETTTHTPHPTDLAPESGYVCASPISVEGSQASQSSSDGPYFDPESSDAEQRSLPTDYHDCIGSYKREGLIATIFEKVHNGALKLHSNGDPTNTKVPLPAVVVIEAPLPNGLHAAGVSDNESADSCSDSLPPSQSTTTPVSSSSNGSENTDKSESTVTGLSSQSNSTLLDETETELGQPDEDDDGEEVRDGIEGDVESQLIVNKDDLVVDGLQQNNLSGLVEALESPKLLNGQCNGYGNYHEDETSGTARNGENDLRQPNGHLPQEYSLVDTDEAQPEDEVDHCRAIINQDNVLEEDNLTEEEAKLRREHQMQMRTERIILECLNIIDATPEASPEPEGRESQAATGAGGEGQLKVEDGLDTEADGEADERPQRVRRCSSLKTGKTPPGTPGRKKIVRFADVLGLDLAAVRTFMDEMPKIPKSAFEDLDLPPPSELNVSLGPRLDKVLVPLFQQPGSLAGFLDVVRDRQVSLENAAVTDPVTMTISGSVRVRNLDFHKSVYVRYTTDAWRSFSDLQANYVDNSCDGFSDKFTFVIFGNALQVGERIELAVRFHCKGQILWDNNYDTNYCFQCLPVSAPVRPTVVAPPVDSWHGASFY